jgi:hypothetical protein
LPKAKQPGGEFDAVKRRLEAKLLPLDYVNGVGRTGRDRFSVLLVRPITKTESAHIRGVMQNEGAGDNYALVDTGGRFTTR